jgi:hypothetical protein
MISMGYENSVLSSTLLMKKLDHFAARNEQLQSKVIILQEQLNIALVKRYAASSERLSPDQIRLFDEAEADTQAQDVSEEDDTVSVLVHPRSRRGRKVLPENLLRAGIIHALGATRCPRESGRSAQRTLPKAPPKRRVRCADRSERPKNGTLCLCLMYRCFVGHIRAEGGLHPHELTRV